MKIIFLVIIVFFLQIPIYAEESSSMGLNQNSRNKNINLLLVIDVSKSMVKNFKELQNYTYNSIINKTMVDKDYFYCFTFGEYIKQRIEKTLSLPQDFENLKTEIYKILPDENFTDIGLALENLDTIISSKRLPYERTIVFFITDGKNIPPKTSKYSGIDIYAKGAFKFYSEIKSGNFKVMILSIGSDTAALDLSSPLGGEFIEISSTLSAEDLNNKIKDFIGSIEMNASLKGDDKTENAIALTFSSSYSEIKKIIINEINLTIDNEKIAVENIPSNIELNPNEQNNLDVNFKLPENISDGTHDITVEIKSENNMITKSIQKLQFNHKTIANAPVLDSTIIIFSIVFIFFVIIALVIYFLYMFNIVSIKTSGKK